MIVAPESFTTTRLRVRRPQLSDLSAVFAYASDIEVARYMDWPRALTPEDVVRATERAIHRWELGEEFSWRMTVPPDDTPIGGVACSVEGHQAEFGFLLARKFWGKGYATEGASAVFAWLASLTGVLRIQATCDVDNKASARVLEKLGMFREAVLHNWVVRPNLPGRPVRDALLYAWVREA
jgi:RimJ/RimL family protein N-acetyltransferase